MTRTDIPDELSSAVRAAAGAAPPHQGDLATVRRRGRTRRRRRTATVAGFAALAVAGAIAVPSLIGGQAAPPTAEPPVLADPPVAPAEPAEPAQRLLLDGTGWLMERGDDGAEHTGAELGETAREAYERMKNRPNAVGVLGTLAELRPDGEVVELDLDLPGIDSVREVVAMPDGRLAAIGIIDHMPGVQREDGPCVEGVDFPLLVVEADGSVGLSREVRVMCEPLRLIAADAETVYLLRGDTRLVAHDLASGEERVLVESAGLADGNGSVAGGRVATAASEPADEPCQPDNPGAQIVVRAAEFGSDTMSEFPLATAGCGGWPGPVRVSPDGRYAAVAYYRPLDETGFPSELRMTILDLDTGDVVVDELIIAADGGEHGVFEGGPIAIANESGAISGMAWDDERTLRVGWYEVPAEGVHWISDVIQVSLVAMP